MPNPAHVNVVSRGSQAIEEWKKFTKEESLSLRNAVFCEINLSKADLSKADLSEAEVHFCDLSWSNLFEANLAGIKISKTNLQAANLSNASLPSGHLSDTCLDEASLAATDLSACRFDYCSLRNTNLSHADLLLTEFNSSQFWKTDFSNATMRGCVFVDIDMSTCVGLKTVEYDRSNSIDFATMVRSYRGAANSFTPELKSFFIGSGIPEDLLDEMRKYFAKPSFCKCFISYGEPDLSFAEKLVKVLRERGVPAWLYHADYTPGERTWKEIGEARREAEKIIVLCSARSLIRDGFLKEIEQQIDEDPEKIIPISLDDLWRQNGFLIRRGRNDLKPFLADRNYIDFSDESRSMESLEKLLKAMRSSK
jgi:uncharacterized protein YjbI with pentapeptide repeats